MPKSTFFNIEEEKRNRIEKAAFNEFYKNKFNEASINNIVKEAKISKGSFYQYFEDKYDIYKHIMDIISQEKIKYLMPVMEKSNELDFFIFLKRLYIRGCEFAVNNPIYYKVAYDFLKDPELMERIYKEYKGMSNDFMFKFLRQGIENGSIREDIDLELISCMISGLNESLSQYIINNVELDNVEKLEYLSDVLIDFLKNGIGK
ncbi:TetR/AcrR family transcriptional regulator [Anaeromicrobium sediminis]|nr:TetR/AcrR family transcriptional regulator [Anaeromicrobium sediminis]